MGVKTIALLQVANFAPKVGRLFKVQFITFTTDWGFINPHTAPLKAALLTALPQAQLLDISHCLAPFDLPATASLLADAMLQCPTGTIHTVWVDSELALHRRVLLATHRHQHIVVADNGLLSLLQVPAGSIHAWQSPQPSGLPFAEAEQMLAATIAIAQHSGGPLPGLPATDTRQFLPEQPTITEKLLTGRVVRVDGFGNLVTNISKPLFEQACRGRKFIVVLRRHDTHNRIDNHYNDSRHDEGLFCLFNTGGWLEVGLYRENASKLLGMEPGKAVMVEFW